MFWLFSMALAGEWKDQPIDPRSETDFTAYTLDPRKFRLGVFNLDMGVFDNFQIGITPLLYLILAPNVHAKATVIDQGKFAMSLQAGWLHFSPGTYPVTLVSYPITLQASWMVKPKWSLHGGLRIENFEATGERRTIAG